MKQASTQLYSAGPHKQSPLWPVIKYGCTLFFAPVPSPPKPAERPEHRLPQIGTTWSRARGLYLYTESQSPAHGPYRDDVSWAVVYSRAGKGSARDCRQLGTQAPVSLLAAHPHATKTGLWELDFLLPKVWESMSLLCHHRMALLTKHHINQVLPWAGHSKMANIPLCSRSYTMPITVVSDLGTSSPSAGLLPGL